MSISVAVIIVCEMAVEKEGFQSAAAEQLHDEDEPVEIVNGHAHSDIVAPDTEVLDIDVATSVETTGPENGLDSPRKSRIRRVYKQNVDRTLAMRYKARHVNGRNIESSISPVAPRLNSHSDNAIVAKYKAKVANAVRKGKVAKAVKQQRQKSIAALKGSRSNADNLSSPSKLKKDLSANASSADIKPEYIQWAVEAMRKVKSQKQQPNLERICRCVQREHGLSDELVAASLAEGARQGQLVALCTPDGVMTYREGTIRRLKAFANRKRKNMLGESVASGPATATLQVSSKMGLVKAIIRQMKSLSERDSGNGNKGMSLKRVVRLLRTNYKLQVDEGVDLKRCVKLALRFAIKKGKVKKIGMMYKLSTDSGVASDAVSIGGRDIQDIMSLIKSVRLKTVSRFTEVYVHLITFE